MTETHPHKVILFGITGSTAHGLAGPDSDLDMRGVFVYPTETILGLERYHGPETVKLEDADVVTHEVGKFVRLGLAANPDIFEVLFLPEHIEKTIEGELLLAARPYFLSQRVRGSFGEYAMSQYKRLKSREENGMVGFGPKTSKRRDKHARHLARLLLKGQELLATGNLTVKLTAKERKYVRAVSTLPTPELGDVFREQLEIMASIDSVLPTEPDYKAINEVLLEIRRRN